MLVNKVKINLSTIYSASTATTLNIPLNMGFQMVDQGDIIERVFVDTEVEKTINPILDYEKVRFIPIDLFGGHMNSIHYNVILSGLSTTYADVGFNDDDIKYEKNNFKQTFLNLSFYDTDNPLNQRLISNITLFSELKQSDLLPDYNTQILNFGKEIGVPGQAKPSHMIAINYTVESPLLTPNGFAEGYHIYDYKDELKIGDFKYLYMRASFNNAKNGSVTNLMSVNTATTIDNLVHLLYTRYELKRTNAGFYYEIDNTYHGLSGLSGSNNVTYSSNIATVNLFKIKVI